MAVPQNATFGTFVDGGDLVNDDIVVGLRNGLNTRFSFKADLGIFLPLAGGTMSGAIDMGSNIITDLPAPVSPSDAVNKAYADALVAGNAMTGVNDTNVTLTLGGTPLTSLLQAVSLTLGWTGLLSVPRGGSGAASFTAYSVICGGTTSTGALQNVLGVGTANQVLVSNGAGALPSWQTVPGLVPAALTEVNDTNVTLTLGGTPNTSLLQAVSLTLGWTGTLSGTRGGTGVNNGANTATFAGNLNFAAAFTTSGAFAVTQTYTAPTNVTFPTSGTLATTSQLPTPSALTKTDDTNVTLTLGGSPTVALLAATSLTLGWTGTLAATRGGTGQSTYTLGDILYSSAANTLSKLAGNITSGIQYLAQTGTGAVSAAPVWTTIGGGDITGAALTKADDTNVTLTLGGTPTTALLRAASITAGWTGQLSIARGGTAVSSVTTSPTATAWAGWDANKNLSANSFLSGYTTTATAAGTTTLVVGSTYQQFFTGSTTQTVVLPVTSTLVLGQAFYIVNNSSGNVTVNSSGGNAVQVMGASTTLLVTCILTSGTTAASWATEYVGAASGGTVSSGTINQLAWYAATGTTVSGLATANSSALLTNGSGVPGWVSNTGTGNNVLATSPAITTPLVTTGIQDVNGNPMLYFNAIASANNYFTFQNSVSGGSNAIGVNATGADTNIVMSFNGKGTGRTQIKGTGTNDNVTTGAVGEYISSTVLSGSAVSLSNNTAKTITSISLTAGDWDVWGNLQFTIGGSCTAVYGGISTTNNTLPSAELYIGLGTSGTITVGALVVPQQRISIAATTTVYLIGEATFSTSTVTSYGTLQARRRS